MNEKIEQRIFFGVLLIAVTLAFLWLVRGFVQPIFWAIALSIVFFPMHGRINRALKGRPSIAAAVSVIVVVLIVVLPLAAIVTAMAREATNLVQGIEEGSIETAIATIQAHLPDFITETAESYFNFGQLQEQLSSSAVTVSQFIATRALAIGQNTLKFAVYFFLMLYLLYFFLRDGTRILEGLVRALPFGDERERTLLERFAQVSRATIKGTLVVGIVQGLIGGIAFAVLGLGSPVLWGVVMALLSIVPAVGPAVVWIPAAVMLIFNGNIVQGIVLIVIGTLVIGLADNFLRPLLVGRDTRMPDYLILLSTLGGLTAFGIAGVVIGPIIAAFFLSVWEMAEHEYAVDKR